MATKEIELKSGESREIIDRWQYPRKGDEHLVLVLCRWGSKPALGEKDARQWVTWYFNKQDGGFGEGHYFWCDEETDARADFVARQERHS